MFHIYQRLKWIYQKLHLDTFTPMLVLVGYTVFGAFVFRAIESGPDILRREHYRNETDYAMTQVVHRMLEVKCHDPSSSNNIALQEKHAKEAILWFIDHLNLTAVIEENTEETPWSWIGALFYAGQLYTTIGYGVPTAKTLKGRFATIFYILFGIPIFLIILKDMGRLLSRSLRKLYKRLRSSKRKIAQATPLHKIAFNGKIKPETNNNNNNNNTVINNNEVQTVVIEEETRKKPNNNENSFPIWIALMILICWILFSAAMFCIWENEWGYGTSVYFYFVSISTVGLGDIVFKNPDMMVYNFGLILVGLALLSMCFNLIQVSIERMLNRLLDEYIEEIEKMAEIVTNEDGLQEEAMPLEFKMTGNLLTLPMKRVANESGFLAEAKEWMAGRIANNLIASRLGNDVDEDSEEEGEEMDEEAKDKISVLNVATVQPYDTIVHSVSSSRRQSRISHAPSEKSSKISSRLRHNRPLFNTIRTLEKIRPKNDNFKSAIFSKFVQSDKLNKLIDEVSAEPKKVATISCQTDVCGFVEERKTSRRRMNYRLDSNSSFSTVFTNSLFLPDDDSLMSAAFCDLKFDYSTDAVSPPSLHKISSQSIFRMDDDDVLKVPREKINPCFNRMVGLPPAVPKKPSQQISPMHSVEEKDPIDCELLISPRRLASLSDIHAKKVKLDPSFELLQARKICGLIPQDFDSPSNSNTTSQIEDSGYDQSTRENV